MKEIAMPYLLEGDYRPHWAETEASNKRHLASIQSHSRQVLDHRGLPIFEFVESNKKSFLYAEVNGLIAYGLNVVSYQCIFKRVQNAACQVSVFRNKHEMAVAGVAKKVFWELLFPKTHLIISDSGQSEDGRAFWGTRVDEALSRGLSVWAFACDEKARLSIEISNVFEIHSTKQMNSYYSRSPFEVPHHRFAITKE